MSEYRDFPRDFIDRSKANVENYSGEYEITNLINNCLGLVIIPKEKLAENIPEYQFDDNDKCYGITRMNITHSDDGYSLSQVVRHIRNGLAHGRIEQRVNGDKISGLRIHDKLKDSSPENFSIEFTVEEFKCFAFSLSSKLIEQ
ncbi:MAG: hypothetical protein FVQ84_13305 [Planctomycetes bacterium]|nr:hypothetical protein [Planctomycetota bacterium]